MTAMNDRDVFLAGLFSRVVVVVLGCVLASTAVVPDVNTSSKRFGVPRSPGMGVGSRRWIEPWYHWDAVFYEQISREGYEYRPGHYSSAAFLPLLPVVMGLGARVGLDR